MSTLAHGPVTGRPPAESGYTRISAQALSSTARAVAGDLFGVDPYLVRVFLRDDAGFLVLGINLSVPLQGLPHSIMARAKAQRPLLGEQFTALTGALVSRVDIRITGVVTTRGREMQ